MTNASSPSSPSSSPPSVSPSPLPGADHRQATPTSSIVRPIIGVTLIIMISMMIAGAPAGLALRNDWFGEFGLDWANGIGRIIAGLLGLVFLKRRGWLTLAGLTSISNFSAARRSLLLLATAGLPLLGLVQTAWPLKALAAWTFSIVGVALVEEVIFRGVAFVYLADRWSDREHGVFWAAAVSSALFGIAHIHPVAVVIAAAVGFALTRLQLDTRSMLPGMLVHFVYDIASHFPLDAQGNEVDSIWGIGTAICIVPLAGATVLAHRQLRNDARTLDEIMVDRTPNR